MTTAPVFEPSERNLLKLIAGRMIPPELNPALPGADDEEIMKRIFDNDTGALRTLRIAMHNLLAEDPLPVAIGSLDSESLAIWIARWEKGWPGETHTFFSLFMALLLRAYYRDARVLNTYGRRPGPPFPEGYVLEQGDWSLLDAVRDRPPLFRAPPRSNGDSDGKL